MERLHYQPIKQFPGQRRQFATSPTPGAWRGSPSVAGHRVMTDLRADSAATIDQDISLAETNHSMIPARCAPALRDRRQPARRRYQTASDLLGEKPTRVAHASA